MGGSKPPKFDFDLALKTQDGRVQIGAISTGAKSWMKLGTRAYTLRDGAFDGLVESGKDDASAGLSTFGVDPRPWMDEGADRRHRGPRRRARRAPALRRRRPGADR